MKNIHVLPTEKPSNLFKDIKNKLMFKKDWIEIPIGRVNQNIYINSDKEIKGGDYYYDYFIKQIGIANNKPIGNDCKKIILTTDQDLIKDGVQAINDELLEWFVKNPSCEFVEVREEEVFVGFIDGNGKKPIYDDEYKIIIPKEEPIRKIDTCYNFCKEIGCVQDICRCEEEEYNKQLQKKQSKIIYSEQEVKNMLFDFADIIYNNFQNRSIYDFELRYLEKDILREYREMRDFDL